MKRIAVAALALAACFMGQQAQATFTYIPAGQETPQVMQETAREAQSGVTPQAVQPLYAPPPAPTADLPRASRAPMKTSVAPAAGPRISPTGPAPTPANIARENKRAQALLAKARSRENRAQGNINYGSYQQIQPVAQPMMQQPAFTGALVIGRGSMRDQLARYVAANGYQLAWNCPNDLQVVNQTVFSAGDFVSNIRQLFETLQQIGRRDISATLFQGNRTLVVEPAKR